MAGSSASAAAMAVSIAVRQGTPSEIVNNADVRRVYLGEHFRM